MDDKNDHTPDLIAKIRDTCIDCPQCQAECTFLARYGTPREILSAYDATDPALFRMAYECSLCGLCGAVCPVGLRPGELFMAMRREAVSAGIAPLRAHKRVLAYEKRGTSRRYSYYSLPRGCDTVFFPGCALPGTRPSKTLALYDHLKTLIPDIGIVLDCCCKPSRDLGRTRYFLDMLAEMKSYLSANNIKRIVTACPNCHVVFTEHGHPFETQSVYDVLAKHGLPPGTPDPNRTLAIHDACATRHDASLQDAVRRIADAKGLHLREMPHSRKKALCCGKGGAVECVDTSLPMAWRTMRMDEAADNPVITYCAGCTEGLKGRTPVFHLIDLLFDPNCIATGNPRASGSPITYLNRLWLKHTLKKRENPAAARERTYSAQ